MNHLVYVPPLAERVRRFQLYMARLQHARYDAGTVSRLVRQRRRLLGLTGR